MTLSFIEYQNDFLDSLDKKRFKESDYVIFMSCKSQTFELYRKKLSIDVSISIDEVQFTQILQCWHCGPFLLTIVFLKIIGVTHKLATVNSSNYKEHKH